MPADVLAVTLAVGTRAHSRAESDRVEKVSGIQDPARGRMAGQERRIDDTILIREAQRGNRGAFEELVRHYDQAVLRLALHLTGTEHDAQDVYQDAFLKAYKNIGSFRFECSFYTWIYRIVTNLCLDHLRKKTVRKEDAPVATDASGYWRGVSVSGDRGAGRENRADLNNEFAVLGMDKRVPESAVMQGAAGSSDGPCAHHRDRNRVLPFSSNGGREGKEESHLNPAAARDACLPMVGTDHA